MNLRLPTLALLLLLPAPTGASHLQAATDANEPREEDLEMEGTIDGKLFIGSGPSVRSFVVQAVIEAPRDVVYAAWTDPSAFVATYGRDNPELAANIDLAIGGRYEWLWDGTMGSNGCQVLSYIPNRMISFSWNAPPEQPESRALRTWVVVEFATIESGGTGVTLTHLGFGREAHWDVTYDYFAKAWPYVLEKFRKNLESAKG